MVERLRDRNKQELTITLTRDELEDLIYEQCKRANNHQYKGIVQAFLGRFDSDHEALLDGLDWIIAHLKASDKVDDSVNASELKAALQDNQLRQDD